MRCHHLAVIASLAAAVSLPVVGDPQASCPRTTASDPAFGGWRPGWYGTDALAVEFGDNWDGAWPTTSPGARIAVKVFWWSAAFRAGTQSSLKIEIENLSGGAMTARVTDTTNAYLGELTKVGASDLFRSEPAPDKWRMLVGIDFPDPGCWQITGEFFGQKLTFVVETADG
jgi:hypothetical protein